MVVIELREAAYDKMFNLLDEIKDLGKKKRMVLCELEDAMYECYEASKGEEHEDAQDSEGEMEYRRRRGMRSMKHEHDYYDDDDMDRGYRFRRGMRKSGRYSY